jgi:potassium efflux system protein
MKKLLKKSVKLVILSLVLGWAVSCAAFAEGLDRLQMVNEQIALLKSRLAQTSSEWVALQKTPEITVSQDALNKSNKQRLDKANLDVVVAKSNADSISIELADAKQSVSWLQKNIKETNDQLNVLNIFGKKLVRNDMVNPSDLQIDLINEQHLLDLEKTRVQLLGSLQTEANAILQFKKDQLSRLNAVLKSSRLLQMKQDEVADELAYQQQQNRWLSEVNTLSAALARTNPATAKAAYISLERDIFYANESANEAYVQSLLARYQDQVDQMKQLILKSSSLSLLNDVSDQVQSLNKQMTRLDGIINTRMGVMDNHIRSMQAKVPEDASVAGYLSRLTALNKKYKTTDDALNGLVSTLKDFRSSLDVAIQTELSSRQGFPMFGVNSWLDLGHELLIVPGLMFQVVQSLVVHTVSAVRELNPIRWMGLFLVQFSIWTLFYHLRMACLNFVKVSDDDKDQMQPKRLLRAWLARDSRAIAFVAMIFAASVYLGLPPQNYSFVVYLGLVYIIFKGVSTLARLCLVETLHHAEGRDMSLYQLLQWMIKVGGVITALTVFIAQLPLIFELKTLLYRLFLMLLVVVSLLLLRFWDVVPNLIISHMEKRHPYLERSVRLIGVILPLLLFINSVMGLLGYFNLIMTISWYEGVFVLVLMGYLTLRGLLTDGMEQVSRYAILYTNNGWLWTEAFLKPIDRVLRLALFMAAWGVLFLLYGWDKQSPIVERLLRLAHYQLVHVFNTTITPMNITALLVVISVFYWTAKWTREFVYRLLVTRTDDMGIRNSLAILSQYSVVVLGLFLCLRVLGIDFRALAVVAGMFAFGVGLGLRDLANNFACGFLILLERPLRVGDIVEVNDIEGEVSAIGGRAVTIKTWNRMDLVVPNTEIFNKSFINWTARDNTVRAIVDVKISRHDNPHDVAELIKRVIAGIPTVLKEPAPEVFLREMDEHVMCYEIRYFVNIRSVPSRISVTSTVLMSIWDAFAEHGIKAPYPRQEVLLRSEWQGKELEPVKIAPVG